MPYTRGTAAPLPTAHGKHAVGVAVIGAAVAVFACGAAKFRHGNDGYVLAPVAQVQPERGEGLAEIGKAGWPVGPAKRCALHLVNMMVPASHIGERHLDADVCLDKLRNLAETVAEAAFRIIGAGE